MTRERLLSEDLKNRKKSREVSGWNSFLATLQPNSRKQYESTITEFNEWFGHDYLDDADVQLDVSFLKQKMKESVAPGTRSNHYLKAAILEAYEPLQKLH